MFLKIVNFIVAHWSEIAGVGAAIWTIIQEFKIQVLVAKLKKVDGASS